MTPRIQFISAGAGSGKTYRITGYLFDELSSSSVRPEGVIATTFTKKAAAELVERVRRRLAEQQRHDLAASIGQSLIGTVNGVCGQLLTRYAFEAGLSPDLAVLDEESGRLLFGQALEQAADLVDIRLMNALEQRLGQEDWKGEVKRVVDMARANNLAAEDLPVQAERSLKDYLDFFPKPLARDPGAQLGKAIAKAIKAIEGNDDETKGTQKYLDFLRGVARQLEQAGLPWSQWVKLSKEAPTKRSLDSAAPVQEIARDYERHPGLRRDLEEWTRGVFALAAKAMRTYERFKAERGLMDFVDQEQKVLHLLELPEVAASISAELDLLLVDEFQDTSPIQLGVFLKLATLAKKTVWVGDVKQAIYGFRGCDPELMNAVVRGLRAGGGAIEVLGSSYRSRPQLVHLTNSLFVPAFAALLEEKQVRLAPARKEVSDDSALEFWLLEGSNQAGRAQALAAGVAQLFAEKRQVVDKKTSQLRPLRYGDLALLSRTNKKAADYAQALTSMGLPVALGQAGLLATPEACLALACLRRLADPADTLASAEVIALHGALAPEEWLENRLKFLEAGGASRAWGIEGEFRHPVLTALETERQQLVLLSPSEALARAMAVGEVERAACAWGSTIFRAQQRLANLEALRALALGYEDACRQQRSAATIGGLILWLQDLQAAELDTKGLDPQAEAIQVLTHHGAKGLEWPVVICADLETEVREGIWGLHMASDRAEVDMNAPLEGRRLNYWAWPFGPQSSGIAVADAITEGPIGQKDWEVRVAEAKRLLYVSLTRARDLLILPFATKSKAAPWLDTLEADWLQPTEGILDLSGKEKIRCKRRELAAPLNLPSSPKAESIPWFPPNKPRSEKLPATLLPSDFPPVPARVGRVHILGERIPVNGKPEMDLVGTAIHDIIAADLSKGLGVDRERAARELLKRNGLDSHLDAGSILARSEALCDWLKKEFQARAFLPEWPIQTLLETGQRVAGWVDLLVDTPNGWILIDHKAFPGRKEEWPNRALEYSGQLSAYRRAVEKATGRPVLGQWIHFCVGGGVVEVVNL